MSPAAGRCRGYTPRSQHPKSRQSMWLRDCALIVRAALVPKKEYKSSGDSKMGTDKLPEARELAAWQLRLLPFTIFAISGMAIYFFVISIIQFDRFTDAVAYKADERIERSIIAFEKLNPSLAGSVEELRWKTAVRLEQSVIQQRYAQVNATLMLRAWTRHTGFLIGMILAFVGAIFILAKLSETETRLSVESTGVKGALATNSPGIVLAVLGSALMIVTLLSNFEFVTRDVPVYLGAQAAPELPPPPVLNDPDVRRGMEESLFNQGGTDAQEDSAR